MKSIVIYIFIYITINIPYTFGFGSGTIICDDWQLHPLPPGAIRCAIEGQGKCSGPGIVYYGNPSFNRFLSSSYLAEGQNIDCNNAGFGCDPQWWQKKECYMVPPPTPKPTQPPDCPWQDLHPLPRGAVRCSIEYQGKCTGPGIVYYGTIWNRFYASSYLSTGQSIDCSNAGFGCDPEPGEIKECYMGPLTCPLGEDGNIFCSDKEDGNYENEDDYPLNYYITCVDHKLYCKACPQIEDEDLDGVCDIY